MFNDLIKNINGPTHLTNTDPKNISVYPISTDNLEGIKILIDNCVRMGSENNNNVTIATVNPSIWLGDFLNRYFQNISYVTTLPSFHIMKIEDNKIVSNVYSVKTENFESEVEIDEFFNRGKWKKFVLFSIVKYVDLENLSTSYRIRCADITEKYEERDGKINAILQ